MAKTSSDTSFSVRPDSVTTTTLNTLTPEDGRIIWDKTEGALKHYDGTLWANSVLLNRVDVTQNNKDITLGGTIDSTKEYFLDGVIDMGTTEITVPSDGINIKGFDFNISGLTSSEDNYTMFNGVDSGDVLWSDFKIEVTGISSKVLNLKSDTGFNAFEISRINFNDCTSLGVLDNYRQGLEVGTGRFGGTPELELKGVWVGGFFIDTSIVRSLTDGSYSLYKAGAGFLMSSRFRSNQNIDLPASVSFVDFTESNFVNASTLQLEGCLVTRNGVFNASDSNLTPNISASDLISKWEGNNGLPNTFVGGQSTVTSELETTISIIDTFVDLAGTFTAQDMQHFDTPSNGHLRHLGNSPREYSITGQHVIESSDGDVVNLKVVIYRSIGDSFEDGKTTSRVIDRLQGVRNVAYFVLIDKIILNQNDYVKLMVSNSTSTDNVTSELDGFMTVQER